MNNCTCNGETPKIDPELYATMEVIKEKLDTIIATTGRIEEKLDDKPGLVSKIKSGLLHFFRKDSE